MTESPSAAAPLPLVAPAARREDRHHPAADVQGLPHPVRRGHGLLPRVDVRLRGRPYQLYLLTSSNLAVGAMGVVQLIPLLVFGLYGGALADHVDRRRLLIGTGRRRRCSSGSCWSTPLGSPQVWVLYLVGALLSTATSLQRPSREALIPRVVKHDELPAAVAVSSVGGQIGMLGRPGGRGCWSLLAGDHRSRTVSRRPDCW